MNDLSFSNLGAQQSDPDYRDHKDYALASPLPASFETDYNPIVVTHQKKLGICTSNLALIIERLYLKKTGVYRQLSRRFLYSVTKNLIDEDTIEGSSLRNALKAAYNYGVCLESTFPSDTEGFTHDEYIDLSKIPANAWKEAKQFQIGGYISIPTDHDSLRQAIYKYGDVYTMMLVGKEWWTGVDGVVTWSSDKIDPLRPPVQYVSGHATVDYGWDGDFNKKRNSWSTAWDRQGNATYRPDTYETREAWAVTLDRIANDLPPADQFHHTFTTPMQRGSRGTEVVNLQIALMISGDMDFVPVVDRGFYGARTQRGVMQYQQRKGISPNYYGYWCGKRTLAALTEDFK